MAAAAFSCCAIERTATDEREEGEEEDIDEIIGKVVDDDDNDGERASRRAGEAAAKARRGAGADDAEARARPREDVRERDAVIGEAATVKKKRGTWDKSLGSEEGKGKEKKKVREARASPTQLHSLFRALLFSF